MIAAIRGKRSLVAPELFPRARANALSPFLILSIALLAFVSPASASPAMAKFALIVGVNRSVDEQTPLRYADDDAALYFELFRTLGARTYLLTRADENTSRLHSQAIAEASVPRRESLEQASAQLQADVRKARALGVKTVFYFVYAGHGNIKDGQGYIALEDDRLYGKDLERLTERVHADQAHLIVDACYSYFLAYDRGPGGQRRSFSGLRRLGALAERDQIGLLLSTSSARESHEWEGFQAGVFSHEVRSGLYGAADADGDGQVSYREIAAFVERANAGIQNERFRPDVFARPPQATSQLVELPSGARHVDLPGGSHFILENRNGVRLAEVHASPSARARLVRPSIETPLYVHRVGADEEYVLPAKPDDIVLASLSPQPLRAVERGAAHEAFTTIFSQPFDGDVVARYQFRQLPDEPELHLVRRTLRLRRAGASLIAGGAACLVAAIGSSIAAVALHDRPTAGLSQVQVSARNQQIADRDLAAGLLYGAAGAFAAVGTTLLLVSHFQGRGLSLTLAPGAVGGAYALSF